MPHDPRLTAVLGLGIFIGLVFFFRGFRVYRVFRVEEDMPEIPIRSVAMGLVHVHGDAEPGREGSVLSPVGHTECLFYKVNIDHWEGNAEQGNWRHWKTAWGGPQFTLKDETGQVTVDGHGCELMVGQNTQAVVGGAAGQSMLNEDIDNDPYAPPDPYATPPASGTKPLTMAVEPPPGDSDLMEFAETAPGGGLGGATGYYRLTEYLVLPGMRYDVVGTYMENPEPLEDLDRAAALKDPNYTPPAPAPGAATDRRLIGKGQNERTFVISGDDRQTTQVDLRHRAFVEVFGGAALAVLCLTLLLGQFGLL